MIPLHNLPEPSPHVLTVYVRRSSRVQKENDRSDAQQRAIREAAQLRGLPDPISFEDDERRARGRHTA